MDIQVESLCYTFEIDIILYVTCWSIKKYWKTKQQQQQKDEKSFYLYCLKTYTNFVHFPQLLLPSGHLDGHLIGLGIPKA